MKRRVRSNAPFILSLVAAAGLILLSLLPRESGTVAWVLRVVAAIVLASFGPIATQVEKRRADEAKRLDVRLAVREGEIKSFPAEDPVIEEWLADEQAACLVGVNQYEHRHAEPIRPGGFVVGSGGGPTVRDVVDLERREAQGQQLTPEERRTLSEARESMAETRRNLLAALSASTDLFSRPEGRTPQQYRDEVRDYIDKARVAALLRLTQEFVAAGLGRIQIELTNATDRPFQSVIVELRLPANGEVFTKVVPERDRECIPPRPREFGQRERTGFEPSSLGVGMRLSIPPQWPIPAKPQIRVDRGGDFVKVKFPGVELRATGVVALPEVFVVVPQGQGSSLEIAWEATDVNAHSRVVGTIRLHVGAPPSVAKLIGGVLPDLGLEDMS